MQAKFESCLSERQAWIQIFQAFSQLIDILLWHNYILQMIIKSILRFSDHCNNHFQVNSADILFAL